MKSEEFYSNERVIGHHISAEYEVTEGPYLGGNHHRIYIEEGDVKWGDTEEVVLTPEEIIALYDALIQNHLDDMEQLAENKARFVEGAERSELVKEVLDTDAC